MAIKRESFEGLTPSANIPYTIAFPDFLMPGFVSTYQFPSGLQLRVPIPNNAGKVLIGDFSQKPGAQWGLGSNGAIEDAGDVPHGSAYLGRNDLIEGSMTFGFNKDVYTVGAYVDGLGESHNRIAVYDKDGKLLTGSSIRSVLVEDWDINYIQVMSNKPIGTVVFTGINQVIDDVTFSTSKPDVIKGKTEGGKVNGTKSDDLIIGKKGNEKIKGKAGDDTIDGKRGNDKIHGDAGNDTLSDGKGVNKLWGDEGQDSFLFRKTQTQDILKDFDPIDDTILLAQTAFSVLPPGQLSPAAFHIGPVATNANQRIIYDDATGRLYYDEDGNGAIAPVTVAKLPAGLLMSAADFFVA